MFLSLVLTRDSNYYSPSRKMAAPISRKKDGGLKIYRGSCIAKFIKVVPESKTKKICFDMKSYRIGSGTGVVTVKDRMKPAWFGRKDNYFYDRASFSHAVICYCEKQKEKTVLLVNCSASLCSQMCRNEGKVVALFPITKHKGKDKNLEGSHIEVELELKPESLVDISVCENDFHPKSTSHIVALTLQETMASKRLCKEDLNEHIKLASMTCVNISEGQMSFIFGYTKTEESKKQAPLYNPLYNIVWGELSIRISDSHYNCSCKVICRNVKDTDDELRAFTTADNFIYQLFDNDSGGFIMNDSSTSLDSTYVFGIHVGNQMVYSCLDHLTGIVSIL